MIRMVPTTIPTRILHHESVSKMTPNTNLFWESRVSMRTTLGIGDVCRVLYYQKMWTTWEIWEIWERNEVTTIQNLLLRAYLHHFSDPAMVYLEFFKKLSLLPWPNKEVVNSWSEQLVIIPFKNIVNLDSRGRCDVFNKFIFMTKWRTIL